MNTRGQPSPRKVRQIEINIGKRCNNACLFCSNGDVDAAERRLVPLEMIQQELQRAAGQGVRAVGFLGVSRRCTRIYQRWSVLPGSSGSPALITT